MMLSISCQFFGRRLILWQCMKQTIVATSTTEAEYVAAANCHGQVLWIPSQMLDYGFNFLNTKIYIDNESTICIVKNPVFHSKTKHIEIRHHFIRDAYEKKLIQVRKIHTDNNVADLLTKSFDVSRFNFLIVPRDSLEGTNRSEGDKVQSSNDSPHLGGNTSERAEGGLNLQVLYNTCTFLSQQVLGLQTAKDAQAATIIQLKKRLKKLEKRCKPSLSHHKAWLKSEQRLSIKKRLGKKESVSKHGRKMPNQNQLWMTLMILMLIESMEWTTWKQRKLTAVPKASTAVAVEVDTAKSDVDAARQEVIEEEPVKIKRKDQVIYQIERDEELAHKLHEEELAEIVRIQEENAAQEEASKIAKMEMINEIQAAIDADVLAAQRAAEIRSRPPTKTQLRNLMMTYLKNMGGYKHSELKAKTFEEIQAMYKRQKKIIDDFNLMDSINAVKDSKKEAGEDTSK
ncbi:hypothetical protein Tco_0417096 [Tanacetum coccineum]